MAAQRLSLQSAAMRLRGLGWKAEPCSDPDRCDGHLCVEDEAGLHWHPADPLAFAKWRVRADLDAIPSHVAIRIGRSWEAVRRGVVLGVLGLGGTAAAAALALWLGRHGKEERASPA